MGFTFLYLLYGIFVKTAVFPGTFSPFHAGHFDIVKQLYGLGIFERIIVAHGLNAAKSGEEDLTLLEASDIYNAERSPIEIHYYESFLFDFIKSVKATMVVRGLRNISDFEYEKTVQYWNEDLGIVVPTMYIISDRNLAHISSSAIKQINLLKGKEK